MSKPTSIDEECANNRIHAIENGAPFSTHDPKRSNIKASDRRNAMADLSTPDKILKKALEKEIQARDLYAELARQTSVRFVRSLLETLQNEESKHVNMIQKMLGRLESGKSIG
jgi:rubrerythrin